MSSTDPSSWVNKFVGACFGILGGAIALYCAITLIESILPALVIIVGFATLVLVATFTVRRFFSNRW